MNSIQTRAKQGVHIELDTADKRFAVIVDEAHSSQSGETAGELRGILNKSGIEAAIAAEFLDWEEDDKPQNDAEIETQKNVLREQYKRLRQDNLSFFAFTATPKWKTLAAKAASAFPLANVSRKCSCRFRIRYKLHSCIYSLGSD